MSSAINIKTESKIAQMARQLTVQQAGKLRGQSSSPVGAFALMWRHGGESSIGRPAVLDDLAQEKSGC